MFRAFINWIKSLFLSCIYGQPELDEVVREASPLLLASDEEDEAPAENPERSVSTGNILLALQEPPVTLTDAESELILYYGRKGNNEYINKLSPAKRDLAYALLNDDVLDHVEEIDNNMRDLARLNSNINREESAWKRVKQYFTRGETSEYSLIPCLESFKSKNIRANDPNKDEQVHIIDNIISCFKTCKKILGLHLFKQKAHEANVAFAPSKEEIKTELYREETLLNRKTADLVNDFNKRSDEYWQEQEAEKEPHKLSRRAGQYG